MGSYTKSEKIQSDQVLLFINNRYFLKNQNFQTGNLY